MTTQEFKQAFLNRQAVIYHGSLYMPVGMQTIYDKKELIHSVAIETLDGRTRYWIDVKEVEYGKRNAEN